MTVKRARCVAASLVLVALFGAGCAGRTEVAAPTAAVTETTSPPSSNADQLRAFRDAAAATPFWATADYTPPASVAQVSLLATDVVVGTITSGTIDEPPLDLVPYSGAPTLYQLQVGVVVAAQSATGNEFKAELPVLWGTPEAINDAQDTAAQLRNAVPVGTRVVIVIRDQQGPSMVAMEASTGELVGFHASLDPALAGLSTYDLARQISAAIGT